MFTELTAVKSSMVRLTVPVYPLTEATFPYSWIVAVRPVMDAVSCVCTAGAAVKSETESDTLPVLELTFCTGASSATSLSVLRIARIDCSKLSILVVL